MNFDEKWEIYKEANFPNWFHDVGDKPPIDTLLEHKFNAFKVGWQASAAAMKERCAEIAEEEVRKIMGDWVRNTIAVGIARGVGQKIREQVVGD